MERNPSALPRIRSTTTTLDSVAELEDWIDRNATKSEDVGTVIKQLVFWTLPPKPWQPTDLVNPFRGALETQFWFWNLAANHFLERELPLAAEVWSAHYLCYLNLQSRYRQRYYKGMPLCNIGFAFARQGRSRLAIKSWMLGLIEDVLTDPSTAPDALNYQNLLKTRVPPAVLDQLITTVESRFTRQDVIPLLPESVIELWLHPMLTTPSEGCLASVDRLMGHLDQAYPELPHPAAPWEEDLAPFWSFADWVDGG